MPPYDSDGSPLVSAFGVDTPLKIGDLVEIHGLEGAKELNGLRGRIISVEKRSPSEAPSRYGVHILSNDEKKLVKGANLRKIEKEYRAESSEGLRHRFSHHSLNQSSESGRPFENFSQGQSERPQHFGHLYLNEDEYPDIARVHRTTWVTISTVVFGVILSFSGLLRTAWIVVSFLVVHIVGCAFFTDYQHEKGLLCLCAALGLYGGIGLGDFVDWTMGGNEDHSVGSWSIVVCFACFLYVHSFWTECNILPSDCISSISFFFPTFPAYNIGVVLSCIEFFLEWRYFPDCKIWAFVICAGIAFMASGQFLICSACRTAGRNFWASCRELPDEEGNLSEDCLGLEIPDRRVVQEGLYQRERHPAYLGAMLWGVGVELALCNPLMLLIVGLMLWSSLLYVCIEEEQELYDEFPKQYAQYASLTKCWIPMFHSLLEEKAFQREMVDKCEHGSGSDEESDGEEDSGSSEDDLQNPREEEDEVLPSWDGVKKGGALWNRQFCEPWMLG